MKTAIDLTKYGGKTLEIKWEKAGQYTIVSGEDELSLTADQKSLFSLVSIGKALLHSVYHEKVEGGTRSIRFTDLPVPMTEENALDEKLSFLEEVRTRPAVFIGDKSLRELAAILAGYCSCILRRDGGAIPFFSDFQKYIQKKYEIYSNQHWSRIIRFFCRTDAEAFDRFYEHLDAFFKENPDYKER